MQAFSKILKVGKENRYSFDLTVFLAGQTIETASITTDSANLTIGSTNIDGNIASALFTGVAAGRATIDFEYSTESRSACTKVQIVIAEC